MTAASKMTKLVAEIKRNVELGEEVKTSPVSPAFKRDGKWTALVSPEGLDDVLRRGMLELIEQRKDRLLQSLNELAIGVAMDSVAAKLEAACPGAYTRELKKYVSTSQQGATNETV
jgi:hypothetical protein